MAELRAACARFWFEAVDSATLELVRTTFGLVVVCWSVALLPDAVDFFSSRGFGRGGAGGPWLASLLAHPLAALGAVGLTGLAGLGLVLGRLPRTAAVGVFLGMWLLHDASPGVFNAGDRLLRNIAFLMVLSPLHRLRPLGARSSSPPKLPLWQLRVLQIQLSVIYIATVIEKVSGTVWPTGRAGFAIFRHEDMARFFVVHETVADSLLVSVAVSIGTMVIQTAVALLLWWPPGRRFAVLLGLSLHLAIDLLLVVGFFAPAMGILYLAFASPETAQRVFDRLPRLPRTSHSRATVCADAPAVEAEVDRPTPSLL